jgi:O-antigen ligase
MSPSIAFCICAGGIIFLLYLDAEERRGVSVASWWAAIWLAILASRPVSAWLSLGAEISGETEIEGSSDRNVFLFLILVGLYILKKRQLNWGQVVSKNKALFVLYLFCAISVVWSEDPFVAFKRWLKDFGNVVMVLLLLTEKDPMNAIRAVFVRCGYVLIPLSVLFIRYYPQLGRSYSIYTGDVHYHGVALGKNLLGATIMVLTVFVVADLLQRFRDKGISRLALAGSAGILACSAYLLRITNSATALLCTVLGSLALAVFAMPWVRKRVKHLLAYSVGGAIAAIILSSVVDFGALTSRSLGRDSSLTGRDKIWSMVLAEHTDPLIGTGFNSFWLGNRSERLSEKNHYIFVLNQAHNGYLELYLNGGGIGVALLVGVILAFGRRVHNQLKQNPDIATVRLVFCAIVVIYNWSEAAFFRLSPVWLSLLAVVLEPPNGYPRVREQKSLRRVDDSVLNSDSPAHSLDAHEYTCAGIVPSVPQKPS